MLIIAVIASRPAVIAIFCKVILAPVISTLAPITPFTVIVGLSVPSHKPIIFTPALLIVNPQAVATVSVYPAAT